MGIDLKQLSPAPWGVFEDPPGVDADVGILHDGVCFIAADLSQYENLEFIALARNAFDVMMRRGWSPFLSPEGCWSIVGLTHEQMWSGFREWYADKRFADPFTVLVEADCWYKENVEKTHADQA